MLNDIVVIWAWVTIAYVLTLLVIDYINYTGKHKDGT